MSPCRKLLGWCANVISTLLNVRPVQGAIIEQLNAGKSVKAAKLPSHLQVGTVRLNLPKIKHLSFWFVSNGTLLMYSTLYFCVMMSYS